MSMILYLRRADNDDIAELKLFPDQTTAFLFAEDAQKNGDLIYFDKAWQAVHFTLSGSGYQTESPLGALLNNGEQIGEDTGYGRPWLIDDAQMRAFHDELSKLSDDDIRSRYDPSAMVQNDIYHADAFESEPEEGLIYLMQGIPALRTFAQRCAETGSCALAAIS